MLFAFYTIQFTVISTTYPFISTTDGPVSSNSVTGSSTSIRLSNGSRLSSPPVNSKEIWYRPHFLKTCVHLKHQQKTQSVPQILSDKPQDDSRGKKGGLYNSKYSLSKEI